MATTELSLSPLDRAGFGLDVRVTLADGAVTDAWVGATRYRGLERALAGRDAQAGLVVTPRLTGAASGAQLQAAALALEAAWRAPVPAGAVALRNIAQAMELLQAVPRQFYGQFAPGLVHPRYAFSRLYDEIAKRFTPGSGRSAQPALALAGRPAEVYALVGGQWPHSAFLIPGGLTGAPTLDTVTRATAILGGWQQQWLEKQLLGCSIDRWLANETWDDVVAWVNEAKAQFDSDLGLWIRYALDIGLDHLGVGPGAFLAVGAFPDPLAAAGAPAGADGRPDLLVTPGGVVTGDGWTPFDAVQVTLDVTHSFYEDSGDAGGGSPWAAAPEPLDPAAAGGDRYSFTPAPRYAVGGTRVAPEVGPLARRLMAAQAVPAADALGSVDHDPLIADIHAKKGPSVFLRQLARLHEAVVYVRLARSWLAGLDLHGPFYAAPEDHLPGRGYGATEAPDGALQHFAVYGGDTISRYRVITPADWNASPRDSADVPGPLEQALVGTPVIDPTDPVELHHIARSFAL
ncbi:MAG: nickel-dependent hydrogenase large subunit [Propionibacteriaceae bacterium]|jgi:hydrogenase large subunit|nr:nickel-dependent hydrogenase large subunit [Propionibacteriaceae bacterium]